MKSFLNLGFYNEYIHTPKTWMHTIHIIDKLCTSIIILIISPYQALRTIFIVMLICINLFINLRKYNINYIYLLTLLLYIYNIFKQFINKNYPKFKLKYNLSNIYNQNYSVISLTIRLFCLVTINFILLKTILLSTVYEQIVICIIQLLTLLNVTDNHIHTLSIITLFACQFINQTYKDIIHKKRSIIIRNPQISYIQGWMFFVIYFLHQYIQNTKNCISNTSRIFYSREINRSEFKSYIFV